MPLALIGGEEFADGFEDVHARLLDDVLRAKAQANGGLGEATIAFLPTCAADDGPEVIMGWCDRAQECLGQSGARVLALPIADRAGANDPANVRALLGADWIYLGGGYPHVGMRILAGTPALEAILDRYAHGALLAGASAGAMMVCAHSWVITPELRAEFERLARSGEADPAAELPAPSFIDCLGLIPNALCFPHLNLIPTALWLQSPLSSSGLWMIGVDEQTALTNTGGHWETLGRGSVTLVSPATQTRRYAAGQTQRACGPAAATCRVAAEPESCSHVSPGRYEQRTVSSRDVSSQQDPHCALCLLACSNGQLGGIWGERGILRRARALPFAGDITQNQDETGCTNRRREDRRDPPHEGTPYQSILRYQVSG